MHVVKSGTPVFGREVFVTVEPTANHEADRNLRPSLFSVTFAWIYNEGEAVRFAMANSFPYPGSKRHPFGL